MALKTTISNNSYFLSRHGEAESNTKKILAHTIETGKKFPLTTEGILALTLEASSIATRMDLIITSPILRTKQTAEIYQSYLGGEIHEDTRLLERNDGIFDGKSLDDYLAWYNEVVRDLTRDAPINGENHIDVKRRVAHLLQDLDNKYVGKNILLVSHGTPCTIIQKIWNGKDLPTRNDGIDFPKNTIIQLSGE